MLQQQIAFLDKIINGTAVEGAEDSLAQAKRGPRCDEGSRRLQQRPGGEGGLPGEKRSSTRRPRRRRNTRTTRNAAPTPRTRRLPRRRARPAARSRRCWAGAARPEVSAGRGGGHGRSAVPATATGRDRGQAPGGGLEDRAGRRAENQDVVEDEGRLRVENARSDVVDARNTYRSADTDRPSDIEAQAGIVAQARAQVNAARRDVENTVLIAPGAGTVSAINGSVGEYVAAGGGTTAPRARLDRPDPRRGRRGHAGAQHRPPHVTGARLRPRSGGPVNPGPAAAVPVSAGGARRASRAAA